MSGGAQKVAFRDRETLPFGPMLELSFGTLVTGDRTWALRVSGLEGAQALSCGFWDETTPDQLDAIAAAMRAALTKEDA